MFSASEDDELKFSWAYLHLSCQSLFPDPPGALGDHVVPSPIFLTLFLLEMDGSGCQGFRYIVWMERRKSIELLGWEVITAPFKLGFWCILSVHSNYQEFPSPLLFLSPSIHSCFKVSSEMLELNCSIKICHSEDAVQLVCQKKMPWNMGTSFVRWHAEWDASRF